MRDFNELKVEYVPIDSIKPYENNAKIHTVQQIEQIAQSIDLLGFKDPVGVWHNTIVEGHGRVLAAKKLGMKQIPIIRLDDLTDAERRAYVHIHNQLTLNSDFDEEILNRELEELESLDDFDIDFEDFGFEVFSIDDMEEAKAYDKNNDNREYFKKTFTFPIEKKQQIINYLKKHYDEVIQRIIHDAETNY